MYTIYKSHTNCSHKIVTNTFEIVTELLIINLTISSTSFAREYPPKQMVKTTCNAQLWDYRQSIERVLISTPQYTIYKSPHYFTTILWDTCIKILGVVHARNCDGVVDCHFGAAFPIAASSPNSSPLASRRPPHTHSLPRCDVANSVLCRFSRLNRRSRCIKVWVIEFSPSVCVYTVRCNNAMTCFQVKTACCSQSLLRVRPINDTNSTHDLCIYCTSSRQVVQEFGFLVVFVASGRIFSKKKPPFFEFCPAGGSFELLHRPSFTTRRFHLLARELSKYMSFELFFGWCGCGWRVWVEVVWGGEGLRDGHIYSTSDGSST